MDDPTIEEIKKVIDEKRNKIQKNISPELRQKRLDNLAKGRETRKQKLLQKKSNNDYNDNNDNNCISDTDSDDIIINKYSKNKFDDIYNTMNNIKDMISSQKETIDNVIKSKSKSKTKSTPKIKKVIKTLDLTVNDTEIDNIISNNKTQSKKIDNKLDEFLKVLQKK